MKNPITAAIIEAIEATAPAHTVTVTWANGTRATYSADMLDILKTDPAALDIHDDETGEIVYIKPDPDAATLAPANDAQVWTEEGETVATATESATVVGIIRRQGGYRERSLLTRPHEMIHSETWNDDHKVINVLDVIPDPDGYRAGCAVDIVTRSIVG